MTAPRERCSVCGSPSGRYSAYHRAVICPACWRTTAGTALCAPLPSGDALSNRRYRAGRNRGTV